MSNNPVRHHYVPVCYLKRFTNHQHVFFKKRKGETNISQVAPSQVCFETDGNKIKDIGSVIFDGLQDKYYVEKNAFKRQENNYGNIIGAIIKYSKTPVTIDKMKYRLFLETLVTIKRRNPATRNDLVDTFTSSIATPEAIERFRGYLLASIPPGADMSEIEKRLTDGYIEEYLKKASDDTDRARDMYLSAYINDSGMDTIVQIANDVYQLKQYILFAPVDTQFVTSDNPGFNRTNGMLIGMGAFGGDYELYFPISPSACLYVNTRQKEENKIVEKTIYPTVVNKDIVKQINGWTNTIANSHIFALSSDMLKGM